MSDQSPSRELDKVVIRLPEGLRERIRRAAEENGRSVNSELVKLLDRTYPHDAKLDELVSEVADLIEKQPARKRDEMWRAVFERLEAIRSESKSSR